MKNIIVLALTSFLSAKAFALTFGDLAGTYKITTEMAPVENFVTIEENANVLYLEKSQAGTLHCQGKAKFTKNILTSNIVCENGAKFVQKVNLSKVTNLESFIAPVYSSLYGAELPMIFERLK